MITIDSKGRANPTIDLDLDKLPSGKNVGIYWNSETDQKQFRNVLFKIKISPDTLRKRQILYSTSSIHDSNFLSKRKATLVQDNASQTVTLSTGCTQGSILSPFLYNIIFDQILQIPFQPEIHIQ